MKPNVKTKILNRITGLIEQGSYLTPPGRAICEEIDQQGFSQWYLGCRNIIEVIGRPAEMWAKRFPEDLNAHPDNYKTCMGALEALRDAVVHDLLQSAGDLATADAFDNLLEQAEELFSRNYLLAAGVLGRAVLEEHLRNLCDRNSCLPPNRPTINDLNQAMYKAGHFDKIAMKAVDTMAAAGNHCAHNIQPPLPEHAVEKLLTDVRSFLVNYPLS